jgi:mRNA interferase MazF
MPRKRSARKRIVPDAGDIVVADFPGALGLKRRPTVVLSSATYHATRPDVILGLITSQTASAVGATDYMLQDWSAAGLHRPSAFRVFLVRRPFKALPYKKRPPPDGAEPAAGLRPRKPAAKQFEHDASSLLDCDG